MHFPATERNRDALTAVLRDLLPAEGQVVEIGSGSGEHVAHFSTVFPALTWQPTDPAADALDSIADWNADRPNVRPPLRLDVLESWPVLTADVVLCFNVIHIAPWEVTPALLRGAVRVLRAGGLLVLYGPFRVAGEPTAPSNETFDLWLKDRDPRNGVRQLEDVLEIAAEAGLEHDRTVRMPANNLSVVLRRVS